MKLKEYEEKCEECNGYGRVLSDVKLLSSGPSYIYDHCETCQGKGKIDWIDKIKLRENNRNEIKGI